MFDRTLIPSARVLNQTDLDDLEPWSAYSDALNRLADRLQRDGDAVRTSAADLSVFRVGDDGKLSFVRTYDVDVAGKALVDGTTPASLRPRSAWRTPS